MNTLEKKCTVCKETKPIGDFGKHAKGAGGLLSRCKLCNNAKVRAYRADPDRRKKEPRKTGLWWKRRLGSSLFQIRKRAEVKDVPVTLCLNDLYELFDKQQGKCALSGLPFEKTKGQGPYSMSVDRITPNAGYAKGNVRLVLSGLNSLKSTGTDEDVYTICMAVVGNLRE